VAAGAVIDLGPLILIGPSPLFQDRTCVSGQTCLLDGINGQGLTDNDGFMVLDTCGIAPEPERYTLADIARCELKRSNRKLGISCEHITRG
jgi:hypothetical protein